MINQPTREVKPQIYGLLLDFPHTSFLSVQCAYSLEEAIVFAKLEFQKTEELANNSQPIGMAHVNLFAIKTFEELDIGGSQRLQNFQPMVAKKIKPNKGADIPLNQIQTMKNVLMKTIIDTRDVPMFKKYKSTFTLAEQKFIKKHI